MSGIPPFKNFEDALRSLPSFIGGLDLVGQHKTIADLAFLVQHEIDLAVEGEPNEINCKRQTDTTKRWSRCRNYLLRCKATQEEHRKMNHRYQLTLRPFSFCNVPKGFIPGSAKDLQIRAGNYGSIAYPDKLAADVVEHFDLKYLGEEPAQ